MRCQSVMSMQVVTKLRKSLALFSTSLVLTVAMCGRDSRVLAAPPPASAAERRHVFDDAITTAPAEQTEGLRFLVSNMPDDDLQRLSTKLLLENSEYAYRAWHESPWKDRVPKDVFLNYVLPY